jgi:hypothetical protein
MSLQTKKILVIAIVFILINLIFISTTYLIKNSLDNTNAEASQEAKQAELLKQDPRANDVIAPIVKNQYPKTAFIDEVYVFYPKLADEDSDFSNLTFSINSAPVWLSIVDGGLVGLPTIEDVGSAKVVLELSDGKNKSNYIIYLVVKANENQ